MPTLISYNADVLTEGSPFRNENYGGANHASLIVGRRFNTTKLRCEYIVRNPWGKKACDHYSRDYDCDKAGNVYIPRQDIFFSAEEFAFPELYLPGPLDIEPSEPFAVESSN